MKPPIQPSSEPAHTIAPSEQLMDMLLSEMSETSLKAKENIIEHGTVNRNIYLVKTGLLKLSYFNADKDVVIAMGQIFSLEMKSSLINGTAKERYLALIKNRPDIIQAVPMKTIASYLGVTPSYICHIKQDLAKK